MIFPHTKDQISTQPPTSQPSIHSIHSSHIIILGSATNNLCPTNDDTTTTTSSSENPNLNFDQFSEILRKPEIEQDIEIGGKENEKIPDTNTNNAPDMKFEGFLSPIMLMPRPVPKSRCPEGYSILICCQNIVPTKECVACKFFLLRWEV